MPYGYQQYGGGFMPSKQALGNVGASAGALAGNRMSPETKQLMMQGLADWWDQTRGDWMPGTPLYIQHQWEGIMKDPSLQGQEAFDLDNINFQQRQQQLGALDFFRNFFGGQQAQAPMGGPMGSAIANQIGDNAIFEATNPMHQYYGLPEDYRTPGPRSTPFPMVPNFMTHPELIQRRETGGTVSPNPKLQELLQMIGEERGAGEVPIMAHEGEYVLNREATDMLGKQNLETLNEVAQMPRFQSGGVVEVPLTADGVWVLLGDKPYFVDRNNIPPGAVEPNPMLFDQNAAVADRQARDDAAAAPTSTDIAGIVAGGLTRPQVSAGSASPSRQQGTISPTFSGGRPATQEQWDNIAREEAIAAYSITPEELDIAIEAQNKPTLEERASAIVARMRERVEETGLDPMNFFNLQRLDRNPGVEMDPLEKALQEYSFQQGFGLTGDTWPTRDFGERPPQALTHQATPTRDSRGPVAETTPAPVAGRPDFTSPPKPGEKKVPQYPGPTVYPPPPEIGPVERNAVSPPQQGAEQPTRLLRPETEYRQKHQGLNLDMNYLQNASPDEALSYLYEVAQRRQNPQMTWGQRRAGAEEPLMPFTERLFGDMMQQYAGVNLMPEALQQAELGNQLTEQQIRQATTQANVGEGTEEAQIANIKANTGYTIAKTLAQNLENKFNTATLEGQKALFDYSLHQAGIVDENFALLQGLQLENLDANTQYLLAQAAALGAAGNAMLSMTDISKLLGEGYDIFNARADDQRQVVQALQGVMSGDSWGNLSTEQQGAVQSAISRANLLMEWYMNPEAMEAANIDDYIKQIPERFWPASLREGDDAGRRYSEERLNEELRSRFGFDMTSFNQMKAQVRADSQYRDLPGMVTGGSTQVRASGPTGGQWTGDFLQLLNAIANM